MIKIKNNKFKFAFLMVAALSFIAIPIVVWLLKIGLLLSSFFLPNLILIKINMDEPISVSNYIYYYSCFSAIGVTSIFSYSIYKLSLNIDQRQLQESQNLKNLKFSYAIISILKELKQNEIAYSKNRPGDWTFKKILEKCDFESFIFDNATQDFSAESWSIYADDFIMCVKELNEDNSIINNLEKLQNSFKELKSSKDKYNITMSYENFTELISETIRRLEEIVRKLQ